MVPHRNTVRRGQDHGPARIQLQPPGVHACSCRAVCVLDESFASQRHSRSPGMCQRRLSPCSQSSHVERSPECVGDRHVEGYPVLYTQAAANEVDGMQRAVCHHAPCLTVRTTATGIISIMKQHQAARRFLCSSSQVMRRVWNRRAE